MAGRGLAGQGKDYQQGAHMEIEPEEGGVELYPPWKEALKAFEAEGHTYGGNITREWFARAAGLNLPGPNERLTPREYQDAQFQWLQQFYPFRDAVLERLQMDLVTDYAGGYLIIAARDQTDRAIKDGTSEIKRAIRRMAARVKHTNVAILTGEERQRYIDALGKAAELESTLGQRRRLLFDEE